MALTHDSFRRGRIKEFWRAVEAGRPQKALRDLILIAKYGQRGPLSDMAIFPKASELNYNYVAKDKRRFRRRHSGHVLAGDWDLSRKDLSDNTKLKSCRMHWIDGADWEETPIFQRMLAQIKQGLAPDECRSEEDVQNRYKRLDKIYEQTRQRGRLLRMSELPEYYRREHGAPLVHVARDGTCLRSGGGAHRFAIAKLLDLPEFPAQLGVIHPLAIENGHLDRLRKSAFAPDQT